MCPPLSFGVCVRGVQELAERCVLYCVCRKPYDEELAMIACDRCNQWFHYTCVGLAEPRTPPGKRAGGEVEVDLDFLCADCTQAVARKRAAAAEKRRLQQERKAERARREEQADAAHEQGGQEGGTHEGPGAARSPGPAAVHDGGEASEAGGALPVVPAGLKRKRSVTTRKAKVLPLVSLLEGDPGESDSERSPEGGQGGEGGEGGEDGDVAGEARRPARRTAGVNHKYANGYYVLG